MYSFLLVLIYLAFISLGLPDSLLGSGWPVMHAELGVPVSYMGIVSMIISGGTIVSSLFSDRLTRKFSTRIVTVVSVFLTVIALFGFSFSNRFWMLIVFAIPYGLGAGAIDAALNNYIALHYKAKHMSWLHCFWGIGASTGPAIVSATLNRGASWRAGYGIISALQILLCIVLFLGIPLWNRVSGKNTAEQTKQAPALSMPKLLRRKGVLPLLCGFVFYCAMESTGGLWGATFIHNRYHISTSDAALTSTLYFGALTVGRMASGFAASRFSDKVLIRWGLWTAAAGMVLTLLAGHAWLAMGGIFLIGFGFAPIYPSMLHATPAYFGAEQSQQVMGLEMAFAYVGSTCFPPLFGALTTYFGTAIYPVFLLMCAALAIAAVETTNICFEGKEKTGKTEEKML